MSDDPTEDADRLEAALERIAALASRRQDADPAPASDPATAEVAARLDSLIVRLRATLSHTGA
jgi:hypothetical protein